MFQSPFVVNVFMMRLCAVKPCFLHPCSEKLRTIILIKRVIKIIQTPSKYRMVFPRMNRDTSCHKTRAGRTAGKRDIQQRPQRRTFRTADVSRKTKSSAEATMMASPIPQSQRRPVGAFQEKAYQRALPRTPQTIPTAYRGFPKNMPIKPNAAPKRGRIF